MAELGSSVFVVDPDTHETVVLAAGSQPEPRLARLVTNASAWVGGRLPDLDPVDPGDGTPEGGPTALATSDGEIATEIAAPVLDQELAPDAEAVPVLDQEPAPETEAVPVLDQESAPEAKPASRRGRKGAE
ncbi:hypothetical protein ACIF6L_34760 [Kitasatospora sp. NPDC086009]|uniref:hypothetical protein n=1 Tax=unclassified Kitasatospora TaxID=2633591 RepID=UPI0037C583A7